MASRDLRELHHQTQIKAAGFFAAAAKAGIKLRITCTYRSNAEQAELYAKGRTKPGTIVTKAPPGSSFHNVRRAFDVLILDDAGAVNWPWMDSRDCAPKWAILGQIGRDCGLDWGGYWRRIVDKPHFEDRYCASCNRSEDVDHFDESGSGRCQGDD